MDYEPKQSNQWHSLCKSATQGFFFEMLSQAKHDDSYHRAFFYTMGICEDIRRNIHALFDFREDSINPEGIKAGWPTNGSHRVCLLAFNLWNG